MVCPAASAAKRTHADFRPSARAPLLIHHRSCTQAAARAKQSAQKDMEAMLDGEIERFEVRRRRNCLPPPMASYSHTLALIFASCAFLPLGAGGKQKAEAGQVPYGLPMRSEDD